MKINPMACRSPVKIPICTAVNGEEVSSLKPFSVDFQIGANYQLNAGLKDDAQQIDSGEQRSMHWKNHGILNETEQGEQQVFGLVFQTTFGWGMLRVHAAHIRFESLGLIICHCSWFLEDNTNLVHHALLGFELLRLPHATFPKD